MFDNIRAIRQSFRVLQLVSDWLHRPLTGAESSAWAQRERLARAQGACEYTKEAWDLESEERQINQIHLRLFELDSSLPRHLRSSPFRLKPAQVAFLWRKRRKLDVLETVMFMMSMKDLRDDESVTQRVEDIERSNVWREEPYFTAHMLGVKPEYELRLAGKAARILVPASLDNNTLADVISLRMAVLGDPHPEDAYHWFQA
jgi:hypothetical protein